MEEFTTIKDLETPVKITRYLYFFDALFIGAYTFKKTQDRFVLYL